MRTNWGIKVVLEGLSRSVVIRLTRKIAPSVVSAHVVVLVYQVRVVRSRYHALGDALGDRGHRERVIRRWRFGVGAIRCGLAIIS